MVSLPAFRLPHAALALCGVAFGPVAASAAPIPAARPSEAAAAPASSLAAELALLPDAAAATAWLERNVPVGTALAEFPGFFADANEIFFDGEENLLVFVYLGADDRPWIAWVSFDADGFGVVHTAALDL